MDVHVHKSGHTSLRLQIDGPSVRYRGMTGFDAQDTAALHHDRGGTEQAACAGVHEVAALERYGLPGQASTDRQ
jgi:hypothetical protein